MFIYSTWIIRDYECFVVSKQFVCLFSLHIYASSLLKLQITDKTPECMQHTNFVCILCMCMNFCSKKAYSIFSHAAEIIFRFCLICRANSIFFFAFYHSNWNSELKKYAIFLWFQSGVWNLKQNFVCFAQCLFNWKKWTSVR